MAVTDEKAATWILQLTDDASADGVAIDELERGLARPRRLQEATVALSQFSPVALCDVPVLRRVELKGVTR